jgi:hypothetical protein
MPLASCFFKSISILSVPWDKGILDTKPKELCPGPPRVGSRVRRKTRTPTGYKLCHGVGQRQAAHQVPRVGPVLGSPCGRCPYTGSPPRVCPKRLLSPLLMKGVAWSSRMWPHCRMSPMLHRRVIGRSEPTRQHEVKPAQRDDGHTKLASGRAHIATV